MHSLVFDLFIVFPFVNEFLSFIVFVLKHLVSWKVKNWIQIESLLIIFKQNNELLKVKVERIN